MLALVSVLLLSAAPADAGTEEPAADAPSFELLVPERMLQDLLETASPFDRDITRTMSVMGFSRDVTVSVRLSHPKVSITPGGVRVTMNYALASGGGVVGTTGVITPRLELKPDLKTGDLVARLIDATMSSTGVSIPLEDVVEPIHLPASANGPLDVGGRTVDASGKVSKVVLEDRQVRIIGTWQFRPGAKKPPK